MVFTESFILYIMFVTGIILVLLFWTSRYTKKGRRRNLSWVAIVGFMLIGLCVYFFPFGAIDMYEATRVAFNLDYVHNSLLWYGICIALGAIGVLMLKIGLKKNRKGVRN